MSVLSVAISKRTGERRLLTREEYFALDRASEARYEFFAVQVDPITGTPNPADLERFGMKAGGPTIIEGDSREVSPGIFEKVEK